MSETALLADAFRRVIDARREYEAIDRKHKRAKAQKREAEIAANELMADLRIKSQTLDLGEGYGEVRVVPRTTTYGQVLDRETAIESLERLGRADEIFRTDVAKGVLNEFVREEIEAKRPLPDGIGWYDQRGVTVTVKRA